jgi:hypothetical protein
MRYLAVAGVLLASLVAYGAVRAPRDGPRCAYFTITPDSVFVAAYAPPCFGTARPPNDTLRSWRIPSRARWCTGEIVIDPVSDDLNVAWRDCRQLPKGALPSLLRTARGRAPGSRSRAPRPYPPRFPHSMTASTF